MIFTKQPKAKYIVTCIYGLNVHRKPIKAISKKDARSRFVRKYGQVFWDSISVRRA
jgi:hypothetical protein